MPKTAGYTQAEIDAFLAAERERYPYRYRRSLGEAEPPPIKSVHVADDMTKISVPQPTSSNIKGEQRHATKSVMPDDFKPAIPRSV